MAMGAAVSTAPSTAPEWRRHSRNLGFVNVDCELELVQDMLHHRELLRVHTQDAASAEIQNALDIGVVHKLIKDSNQSLFGLATLNQVVL